MAKLWWFQWILLVNIFSFWWCTILLVECILWKLLPYLVLSFVSCLVIFGTLCRSPNCFEISWPWDTSAKLFFEPNKKTKVLIDSRIYSFEIWVLMRICFVWSYFWERIPSTVKFLSNHLLCFQVLKHIYDRWYINYLQCIKYMYLNLTCHFG